MTGMFDAATANPFRVFLRARRIATLALGLALCELGHKLDPRLRFSLQIVEAELRMQGLERSVRLLRGRLLSIPGRRRPRFTTELARSALSLHGRSGAPLAETAQALVITASTLRRWHRRRELSPTHELVLGPTRTPSPPCTRFDEGTRGRVALIRRAAPLFGKKLTANVLALAGCRISTSSVGRITCEAGLERPGPEPRKPLLLVTTGTRSRGRFREGRRRQPKADPVSVIATPALFPIRELHTRTKARLLVELRDQFHLALIALLSPLRRVSQAALPLRLRRLHEREARLLEQRRILQARLARMRPRKRPHYAPPDRAEILIDKHHFRLSDQATASIYCVVRQTVCSWNVHVDRAQPARLVRPHPPIADHQEAIRRASDVLPAALQEHQDKIAAILAQLTSTASARRRAREPKGVKKTDLARGRAPEVRAGDRSIRSRRPNHYWSVDLTELRSLFGIQRPYLAVILDLYSRYPVAWQLWQRRPCSAEVAGLLEQALSEWGPPRHVLISHLVSDQGREFIGEPFERVLAAHGIDHRFGAVGEHGSIAVIERLWLTLRTALDHKDLPRLRFEDVQRRMAMAIDWYARLRPHSTLKGATPQEHYLGLRPARLDAVSPPRGLRGEPCVPRDDIELRFALPDEKRLPYLVRRAA